MCWQCFPMPAPAGASDLRKRCASCSCPFFGNRDLSDLTATLIADCSNLDQMLSHYVPQLFASAMSTSVVAMCMFLADRIVMLDAGKVKQQGTPQELIEQGGFYRRMVKLQRESAGWRLG